MEAYYDSDEDVSWGPYTKRELLGDVMRSRKKEDVGSRHSISCDPRLPDDIDKCMESLIEPEAERRQLPSVYVTQPDGFIEKISHILNNTQEDPNCSSSSEHHGKWEIHENNETPTETNANLNENLPEDSDVYFTATSEMPEVAQSARNFPACDNTSFITCSFVSEINDNINDLCIVGEERDAETSLSVNSKDEKRDHDKPIQISINDSEESDTSFKFNDTLEEMEMMLNKGLDYSISSDSKSSNDEVQENESHSTSSKLSRDEVQENKIYNKPLRPINCLIPVPCKSKTKNNTPAQSPVAWRLENEFKVPEKPAARKLVSPITSRDRFKNIVSPVAVYIKNTPNAPLYMKVTPKKCKKELLLHESPMSSTKKENKENEVEFPEVIYKQAKHTVTNVEETFKLPQNIESLLPGQHHVIKHVAKIGGRKDSVSRRLLEDDLTINSISDDSSLNSSTQNMSIYMSKRTLI